jgi:hypothetical protein
MDGMLKSLGFLLGWPKSVVGAGHDGCFAVIFIGIARIREIF